MNINKDKFFDSFRDYYKKKTGKKSMGAGIVDSVDFLLDSFSSNSQWKDVRQCAYALATIAHETAWTFAPIAEYGKGRGRSYGRADAVTGKTYYGRGYVQLTWKENYDKAGKALSVDLVNHPELAMDREVAFKILTKGMFLGWFAADKQGVRHKLDRYIHGNTVDYVGARRIINGTDKNTLIAGYAKDFEKMFNATLSDGDSANSFVAIDTGANDKISESDSSIEEPIDNYPEEPKPGEATPDAPAEEGQPVVGGRPGDDPKQVPSVEPKETSGLGAWIANLRAQYAAAGLGVPALGSLAFLTNPLFIKIAIGIVLFCLFGALVSWITTLVIKSIEKRAREREAHELTLKQMELAADPTKYNVEVVGAKK